MHHSDDKTKKGTGQLRAHPDRKPYKKPEVQEFGQLSRVTQGSFNTGNDGAFGMSMNVGGGDMGGGMGMGNQR